MSSKNTHNDDTEDVSDDGECYSFEEASESEQSQSDIETELITFIDDDDDEFETLF